MIGCNEKIQDKFVKVVKHSWQMYYPRRNFFWIALKFRALAIIINVM